MSLRILAAPAAALFLTFSIPHASAETTLDVAGVKLGMTREEATAALKAFDPQGGFHKPPVSYALPAHDIWSAKPDLIFFNHDLQALGTLPAEQQAMLGDCAFNMPTCKRGDSESVDKLLLETLSAPRVVTVWLSPVPGKEKVVAVSSTTAFIKPVPTVADLGNQVAKQYGQPPSFIKDTSDGPWFVWKFDPRGRLMDKAQAASTRLPAFFVLDPVNAPYACPYGYLEGRPGGSCPDVYLPSPVRKGDGTALLAWVRNGPNGGGVMVCGGTPTSLPASHCDGMSHNKLLADRLVYMLYDTSAVVDFSAQIRAAKR